jgi:predicted transcriptional regulator
MEVMISINPPYSKMIFDRYKPFEFRKKVLKGMDKGYPEEDIKAYIYETKNKGGAGNIIGEITVLGSYSLHYGDRSKPDTEFVKERFEFIKELYLYWCNLKGINPNMNEGWFKSKKFTAYQKEIGFFADDDSLCCNYALILDNPILYEVAKPLEEFITSKGVPLNQPPQNMFNVTHREIS